MERGTVQANLYLTATPPRPCLSDTLWSTGSRALGWIYSSTMSFPLHLLIRDSTAALDQETNWRWWRGTYERDFAEFMKIGGREIMRMREEDGGKLATSWIPHLAITDKDSAILHQDGSKLTLRHLKTLGRGTCVKDFVSWTWVRCNTLRFTPVAPFPLTNAQATSFIMLCNTLVANFPGITRRPDPPELVRTYNIPAGMDVEWFLREGILHKHVDRFPISSSAVTSQRAIQRQPKIKTEAGQLIPQFECSPALTRLVRPWRGLQPWKPSRRHFKRSLGRTLKNQGLMEREARAGRWKEEDTDIAKALEKVRWHDFVAEGGLSTYETQLWTRIRHHQLRVWGRSDGERVCQREECFSNEAPAPRHVVWECAHTVSLWRKIAALWGSPAAEDSTLLHAIFSRSPLPTEIDWSASLNTQQGTVVGDRTAYWLKTAWVQLITCGMRRLWAQSVRAAVNPAADEPASGDDFFAVRHQWSNRLRCNITALFEQGGDTADLDAKILRTIYKGIGTAEAKLSRYPASRARYLLFFDGGSRGNPGPGGSGSIVVRLDPEPKLMWTAAMSYAQRTTTNNYAEYQGLCTGHAAATQYGWHPLEIVGDTMMIIRQMIHRRRPKVPQLQPLYERARAAADQIRVRGWHHHYRSYNKMADKAANQAMDSGTSYQAHTSDILFFIILGC
jgi:ribonuclease HI